MVHRVSICWVELRRVGGSGRSTPRVTVHVLVYPVRAGHGPLALTHPASIILAGQVAIVVIHLMDRRIASPGLTATIVLGCGGRGDGDNVGGGGGAGPSVRADCGAWPRNPDLLASEVQRWTCLLAALLGV